MDTHQIDMEKDTVANATTAAGVLSYLMQFQGELTVLLLVTGLVLNLTRIYDRFVKKKKGED